MKTKLTAILIFFILSKMLNAQITLSIIPKAGISLSNINASSNGITESYKNIVGFTGGVAFGMSFNEHISLQPEILYVHKGARLKYSDIYESIDIKFNVNYLEVPILFKYSYGPIYFNVGPYAGVKISQNLKVKEISPNTTITEGSSNLKSLDYGLLFGGGCAFEVGTGKIIIDARYGLGVANINTNDDTTQSITTKNRSLQFTVGYSFQLGK